MKRSRHLPHQSWRGRPLLGNPISGADSRRVRPVHWCTCVRLIFYRVGDTLWHHYHRPSNFKFASAASCAPSELRALHVTCAGTFVTTTGALGQSRFVLTANHWCDSPPVHTPVAHLQQPATSGVHVDNRYISTLRAFLLCRQVRSHMHATCAPPPGSRVFRIHRAQGFSV